MGFFDFLKTKSTSASNNAFENEKWDMNSIPSSKDISIRFNGNTPVSYKYNKETTPGTWGEIRGSTGSFFSSGFIRGECHPVSQEQADRNKIYNEQNKELYIEDIYDNDILPFLLYIFPNYIEYPLYYEVSTKYKSVVIRIEKRYIYRQDCHCSLPISIIAIDEDSHQRNGAGLDEIYFENNDKNKPMFCYRSIAFPIIIDYTLASCCRKYNKSFNGLIKIVKEEINKNIEFIYNQNLILKNVRNKGIDNDIPTILSTEIDRDAMGNKWNYLYYYLNMKTNDNSNWDYYRLEMKKLCDDLKI